MKPPLTVSSLCDEAKEFGRAESSHREPSIYGKTDGRAVGTYFEHKFQGYLHKTYTYDEGSSADGIDFPQLCVDMKLTSVTKPQSSCPYESARQKVYGLGYSLLVFVYDKQDDAESKTATLRIVHTIFVEEPRTADFQITKGIREILENDGNRDDLVAFLQDRNLPVDDIQATRLAEEILGNPPGLGYLTISNALQWRLQYGRVIEEAGKADGILRVR